MLWVIALVLIPLSSIYAQESEDLKTQQLLERAQRVQEKYPWLIQEDRGISVFAFNLPREEFLRGLQAATDIVFDGTDELPEQITLSGFFLNIEEVIKKIGETDSTLKKAIDLTNLQATFYRPENKTLTLSDQDLSLRYRRPKLGDVASAFGMGVYLPGNLIVDGTLIPPPLQIEVIPQRDQSEVQVLCNKLVLKKLPYIDPYQADQNLFQADTPENLKKAILNKADRIWNQVAQIPYTSTAERLNLTAGQIGIIYRVTNAQVENQQVKIACVDGLEFAWAPPTTAQNLVLTEPEAFQKAYELQNQIFTTLASGGIYFVSTQYGMKTLTDGFYVMSELKQIHADESLQERDKVNRIHERWSDALDWMLEYYYTSLKDQAVVPVPEGFPNLNQPLPLPTMALPGK
jgi:hypothetical protein